MKENEMSPHDGSCGIVTLADNNYFAGLKLLSRSVQESWSVPVLCFDAGLTASQKEESADNHSNIKILPLPKISEIADIQRKLGATPPLAKANKRVWPLWICPFLILASPYQRVFWLDCDVVVLRNLRSLFVLLDDGPVFTPENNAPEATPNKSELYELLPIEHPFDPAEPKVNAGVSGWDLTRDRRILDAYCTPILCACEDERIRNAISWHDQGALIWAIQKTRMEHRVLTSNIWNLCVKHTSLVEKRVNFDDAFLENVRREVSEANLLHWNGFPVPWAS